MGMTDYVIRTAVIDKGAHVYRCWRTTDGIDAQRVGCEHETPREAIDHATELSGRADGYAWQASAREES